MNNLNREKINSVQQLVSVYSEDRSLLSSLPTHLAIKKIQKPDQIAYAQNVIVASSSRKLLSIARQLSIVNHRNALRVLLVKNEESPYWTTQFLSEANLRTLRNLLVHSGNDVPRRIIEAWGTGVQHKLIADAVVVEDKILVLDCALYRYELPFAVVKDLRHIPKKHRKDFVIDKDGAGIHWKSCDAWINIESIQDALDPTRARLYRLAYDQKFGRGVARLRQKQGLGQTDIAGLTDRQVRRIEKGEVGPTVKSLEALAAAHKMSLNNYLDTVANLAARL